MLLSSYASILRRFGEFLLDFLAKSHAHYICRIPSQKVDFLITYAGFPRKKVGSSILISGFLQI